MFGWRILSLGQIRTIFVMLTLYWLKSDFLKLCKIPGPYEKETEESLVKSHNLL